jgi:CMP-N-acetylneuraminic acid synthetase
MADLGGKPLVQHTVEAALASTRLDLVLLSSDDGEILELGEALGCEVVRRPDALATDEATMTVTALHALDHARDVLGLDFETLVLLQPTSPFRTTADIDLAVNEFERTGAASLASAVPVDQHPCDCVRIVGDKLERAVPLPHPNARRQEMPAFYYIDGATYVVRTEFLRSAGVFVDEATALHIHPSAHGFDIDSEHEFELARALLATTLGR